MPSYQVLSSDKYKDVLPSTFLHGLSSASYQIEGSPSADGKGVGVWDDFLHKAGLETGDVACESYNLWEDDVKLLKELGCNVYRFSISWPRIRKDGGADEEVNEKGIKYYSDLIDALLAQDIIPCITIYHWDHPLALEQRGGFLDERIVPDFVAYAKVLFERFGDRVKNWITINEPHIFTMLNSLTWNAEKWVNGRDHAIMARNLILSHAKTVDLYRREFQRAQTGKIGITLNCDWTEPLDESSGARTTAKAVIDRVMGFYADPIYLGKLNETILKEFGDDAKEYNFSDEEWKIIKGSSDFFGLNHYGTSYAAGPRLDASKANPLEYNFGLYERIFEKDGKVIGNKGQNGHPYNVPWGFRKLLNYISTTYTKHLNLSIWITENGFPIDGEAGLSREEILKDTQRQDYYAGYLEAMFDAVLEDGVDVGGYMGWSLLDNLEWNFGFGPRFGVTFVDREDGCKRYPKDSAYLLKDIFAKRVRGV